MFDTSVPVFIHYLKALSANLKKAEDHCAAKKIDPAVMLQQRLYPDMFALTRQVQIATDGAKAAGARALQAFQSLAFRTKRRHSPSFRRASARPSNSSAR